MEAVEHMTVIRHREEAIAEANTEMRSVADGGRRGETSLQQLTRRITRRAKGN